MFFGSPCFDSRPNMCLNNVGELASFRRERVELAKRVDILLEPARK